MRTRILYLQRVPSDTAGELTSLRHHNKRRLSHMDIALKYPHDSMYIGSYRLTHHPHTQQKGDNPSNHLRRSLETLYIQCTIDLLITPAGVDQLKLAISLLSARHTVSSAPIFFSLLDYLAGVILNTLLGVANKAITHIQVKHQGAILSSGGQIPITKRVIQFADAHPTCVVSLRYKGEDVVTEIGQSSRRVHPP